MKNCRYCKTAKTCLENAEYNSIYCHMHKRIPKIIDKTYEELQNENQQLRDKLEESEKEYGRTFGLWHNRKLIKKFDDEYDEADKKNNPERDYAYVMPDAEEVYKRYYELKEKLEASENARKKQSDKINNILDYIDSHRFTEQFENVGNERNVRKNIFHILDIDKGEKNI